MNGCFITIKTMINHYQPSINPYYQPLLMVNMAVNDEWQPIITIKTERFSAQGGLCLAISAVLSAVAAHAVAAASQKAATAAPSSCGVARNSTTSCGEPSGGSV